MAIAHNSSVSISVLLPRTNFVRFFHQICQENPRDQELEQRHQTSFEEDAPSDAGLLEFERVSLCSLCLCLAAMQN